MTYEYVCTACGHGWEAEQAISAPPLKTCPKCGTDHAKRQIPGGGGFIFKGGGCVRRRLGWEEERRLEHEQRPRHFEQQRGEERDQNRVEARGQGGDQN